MLFKFINLLLVGSLLSSIFFINNDEKKIENNAYHQKSVLPDNETDSTVFETGEFTDKRDNKTYKWVKFGEKKWMVENLQYKPENGNFRAYDDSKSKLDSYGYLYDLKTAKNVVPEGWHIPSVEEWTELDSIFTANSYNYSTVFNAQLGGYLDGKYFKAINMFGMWWSSDKKNAKEAWVYYTMKGENFMSKSGYGKELGISVRCVQD